MFQRFSETLRFLSTIFAFSNWWISVLSPRQMSNLFWSPGWRRPPTYVCILILMVPVNSSLQCDNEKWGGDWALQTWPGLARIINILNVAVGSEGQSCLEEELGKNNRVTSGLKYYHHRPPVEEIKGAAGGEEKPISQISGDVELQSEWWQRQLSTLLILIISQIEFQVRKAGLYLFVSIIHNSGRPLSLLSEWQISKKKPSGVIWIVQVISVLGIEISELVSDFYLHVVHFQHWPASARLGLNISQHI